MGLDIYAGTLTRYYSHNWKTVVQQWAEKNGYTFNRITPDGEPADDGEELSPSEVENWRDQILAAIAQLGQEPYTPWPEDNERPYYTDKPDWDAFGAMLLVAACHTYDEPVPSTVEKGWNFGEHPLVPAIHTMSRCLPPWRKAGTSGSILWSPVLHRTRSGCGPCSAELPGGCLWRMPSSSRRLCPPIIRR